MRRMWVLVVGCLVAAACGEAESTTSTVPLPAPPTARILLVGDVMIGRGVAPVLAAEPDEVFAGVRHLLDAADLVGANLESPLTERPHVSANENAIEADPATAGLLAAAGFDLMSLPNNHATDAGPDGLLDTIEAVTSVGMLTVGAGADRGAAAAPAIVETEGLSVGFLAYDATSVGTPAGPGPGVATWDGDASIAAVRDLRDAVDVVIVSLHGGTEYLPVTDPGMREIAASLAEAGADVVWGHGAHVVQPVLLLESARPTLAATSLGSFLFDQSGPDRTTGALLEVLVDPDGLVAYRVGLAEHPDRRVEFLDWLPPTGDAAWVNESWWTLVRSPALAAETTVALDGFRHGDLVAAARGDLEGDGATEIVASFRRPQQANPVTELYPAVQWADASGRSAHLGVYRPDDLGEVWVAGTLLMPVAGLAVCDGSLAVVHDQLDDPRLVAGGAWDWNGFGFDTAPDIPGPGTPGCADVDGDGATEPVIVGRSGQEGT